MYEIETGLVMPSKKKAIERGRAMVAAGKARREVAIEIYDEYYWRKDVQEEQYKRRLRELVRLLGVV